MSFIHLFDNKLFIRVIKKNTEITHIHSRSTALLGYSFCLLSKPVPSFFPSQFHPKNHPIQFLSYFNFAICRMTTLFTEDYDKICRCCLCKNGEMRPLFGSCIDNMLRFVAEIDVSVVCVCVFFL